MTRAWVAIALLAGSWLLGWGYFGPPHPVVATLSFMLGVVLLRKVRCAWPARPYLPLCVALLLPALGLWPWPARLIPLALALGLLIQLLGLGPGWPRQLARALTTSGAVLLAQGVAIQWYADGTARGHELPPPLAQLLGLVPRWLGLDSAVDGGWIAIRGQHQVHRIAATWELLLDPASMLFLAGGLVLLTWTCSRSLGKSSWTRDVTRLLTIVLAWAPLRAALLLAIWLQRALRADAITEPNGAAVLVNSWLHLGLLAGPVLLAIWLLPLSARRAGRTAPSRPRAARRPPLPALLTAVGVALLVFVVVWSPVGSRKAGRVTVVERHSTWEPTVQPYGTTVYGEAGSYNYAAAYAYCGQYFTMSRLLEQDTIDDAALADCSVLVIKTPTARYEPTEVETVRRYVERGGSLLLIGDHTNVFNMNTYLNDIARVFGFSFRNDLLFRVGDPYRQYYCRPWLAHAVVQHVPPMDFAVSCSIDPGWSLGRMVIRSEGLYNLPPAYHESNYHPQAEYRPQMQYGAWCQMWASSHGHGRVLAFADSTLFSNFCVFQPGKAELLRGMLDWLGRSSIWDRAMLRRAVQIPLLLVGLMLVSIGWYLARPLRGSWLILASVALAAGTLAGQAVIVWQRHAMPVPPLQRPLPHVVVDRNVSQVPLFTGAFADDKEGLGYGMFEQWIPRIGNVISRSDDDAPFNADGLVIICPNVSVSDDYLARLVSYVEQGGQLLVLDSPDVPDSTANSLLAPFGLTSRREAAEQHQGEIGWPQAETLPGLQLQASCEIQGGEMLAHVGQTPVAAQIHYGRGRVTAIGFGSLFNDAAMGFHWLPEPDELTRQRYEVLYHLLRSSLPHLVPA